MKKQTKKIAQENFLDEIETHYSKIDKVIVFRRIPRH